MGMYDIINQLCKENHMSITKLCELITNSSGNLATWKKGYMRSDYLQKIADYFGVSTDYLLGRTTEKNYCNSSYNFGNHNMTLGNLNVTNNNDSTVNRFDITTIQIAEVFQKLNLIDKAKVINFMTELEKK